MDKGHLGASSKFKCPFINNLHRVEIIKNTPIEKLRPIFILDCRVMSEIT